MTVIDKRPLKGLELILRMLLGSDPEGSMLGDIEEEFRSRAEKENTFRLYLWYVSQIIKPLPSVFKNALVWRSTMFKNYLKIAFRNINKNKGFSFINIFGLSFGMACSILIFLYVQYELSFDNFHKDSERIFRVGKEFKSSGQEAGYTIWTPPPVAPVLLDEYPEVEEAVRIYFDNGVVKYEEKNFAEDEIVFADNSFFNIFSFQFANGSPEYALTDPFTAVITQEAAGKYFDYDDPIGKTLIYNNDSYRVTGVLENIPGNSHLQFDFLLSFGSLEEQRKRQGRRSYNVQWWFHSFATYIKTRDASPSQELIDSIYNLSKTHVGDQEDRFGFQQRFIIEPLKDVYLRSHFVTEGLSKTGNITYVYLFISIAIFILALACINFMNLTTARSAGRIKEISMRKVVGAAKKQLVFQFLTDALFMSFISVMAAVIIVLFALPSFSEFTGRTLSLDLRDISTYPMLVSIMIITGLLSGVYPAFYLTSFKPIESIKGKFSSETRGQLFRKSLVVFQFAISIMLIISSLLVSKQINFMKNSNLGFNREQVLVIPFEGSSEPGAKYKILKNELLKNSSILSATVSSTVPGRDMTSRIIRPEGAPENENQTMNILFADPDFLETFGLEMAAGRFLSEEISTDPSSAFILNEAAVKRFGWGEPQNAVGKEFSYAGRKKGRVVGVVKDFHFLSLHSDIFPIVTQIDDSELGYLSVKLSTENLSEVLSYIEDTWQSILPDLPANHFFLDSDFNAQYNYEEKVSIIFDVFTFLAIIIACLGLFALSSYMAEQKTKEIGIRKALGATVSNVIFNFSKEFLKWILIANIAAWPVAWYVISRWLQSFAYRTEISLYVFILSGLLAVLIAFLTVIYQSLKSSLANPVDSLRYE
ncbi:MAG: FtsX-like permease family protein [bacterium]|nr:FtsX-like permease family protein [bacterium]